MRAIVTYLALSLFAVRLTLNLTTEDPKCYVICCMHTAGQGSPFVNEMGQSFQDQIKIPACNTLLYYLMFYCVTKGSIGKSNYGVLFRCRAIRDLHKVVVFADPPPPLTRGCQY